MGYTTDFEGELTFNTELTTTQVEYLNDFKNSRRMKRDPKVLMDKYNGTYGRPQITKLTEEQEKHVQALKNDGFEVSLFYNGSAEDYYGKEGEFFVGNDEVTGVTDYNRPPSTQPSLWCQWDVAEDRLFWDGGEKFYSYVDWLKYIIENFFKPWGIVANGSITWSGEDSSDFGKIVVTDNIVTVKEGRIVYDD